MANPFAARNVPIWYPLAEAEGIAANGNEVEADDPDGWEYRIVTTREDARGTYAQIDLFEKATGEFIAHFNIV